MSNTTRLRITCPHCGSPVRIRTSRSISPLYREGIADCTNVEDCGWRGNIGVQFVSTLVPSHQPKPDIHLPLSARHQQAQ